MVDTGTAVGCGRPLVKCKIFAAGARLQALIENLFGIPKFQYLLFYLGQIEAFRFRKQNNSRLFVVLIACVDVPLAMVARVAQ